MFFFLIKVLMIVVMAILIRGVLPRYRIDQIIYKNWKVVFFLFILFIFSFFFSIFFYIL